MADPDVAFLQAHPHAEWIRMPQVEGPGTYGKKDFMAAYRTSFVVEEVPEQALIVVYAFRYATVYLDGTPIAESSQDFSTWKKPLLLDIHPILTPGKHELALSIINRTGPPVVLAYAPQLGIRTGPDWQVKDHDRPEWINAVPADAPQVNDIGEKLPTVREAFIATSPLTVPVFVIVFLLAFYYRHLPKFAVRWSPPAIAHWGLLSAWALLALNNIMKVPYGLGFDVDAHVHYMLFILRNHSIPYADQGWQMFQSPLYYLISAPLYALTSDLLSPTHAITVLRIIPIFCGGLQIHLCYLVVREFFPDQKGLQVLGTLIGGFLPINVYQSQNLGNEPLMALFASLALLQLFYLVRDPERHGNLASHALTGLLLGAALLTKATALLLLAPAGLAILVASLKLQPTWRGRASYVLKATTASYGVAAAVSAWYYVRNFMRFGRFFVGGWEELRGYIWWQEPGYRIADHFFSFGDALVYPLYSAVNGFWDGLYSTLWLAGFHQPVEMEVGSYPGWNYPFVIASSWWSLLPTAIILIGVVRILWSPIRSTVSGQIFAVISLALFVAAMAYLVLRLPSFSTIKGTYLLALVTCFSIIAARGFEPFLAHRVSRSLVYAWMAAWAVTVFAAYFVI